MLDYLKFWIDDNTFNISRDSNKKAVDHTEKELSELSIILLRGIESKGMLPPKYTALRRDGTKFIKGENEGDVIQRIAWEPEEGEY